MTSDIKFARPDSSNTLVCFPGNPFEPIDLANMFERGVVRGDVATFNVDHYWVADVAQKILDDFNRLDDSENVGVTVYHTDVDPASRICQSCGKTIGTP